MVGGGMLYAFGSSCFDLPARLLGLCLQNKWAKLGPSKSRYGGKCIMCLKLKASAMIFTPR